MIEKELRGILEYERAWTRFSKTLSKKQRDTAEIHLDLLREYGRGLPTGFSEKIDGYDNLYELRPKNARLFYCFLPGGYVAILGGAIKKRGQRKLPPSDYEEVNEIKNLLENLGNIRWNRLAQLN